jgi:hypothetical protein
LVPQGGERSWVTAWEFLPPDLEGRRSMWTSVSNLLAGATGACRGTSRNKGGRGSSHGHKVGSDVENYRTLLGSWLDSYWYVLSTSNLRIGFLPCFWCTQLRHRLVVARNGSSNGAAATRR